MGCLKIKTKECEYKERDRRFKELIKNGINDMMNEIIREL